MYTFIPHLLHPCISRQDADESEIKVQVCVYAFDLLYLNGQSLVRDPFEKRRALLREHFTEIEGEFMFASSIISSNTEDIQEFLDESVKGEWRENITGKTKIIIGNNFYSRKTQGILKF